MSTASALASLPRSAIPRRSVPTMSRTCTAGPIRCAAQLRVAGVEAVERLAHGLESQFTGLSQNEFNDALCQRISRTLDAISEAMAHLGTAANQPLRTAPAIESSGPATGGPTAPAPDEQSQRPIVSPATDAVRVSAESMDQLLLSSAQLLAESGRQDQISRELRQLNCRLQELESMWHSMGRRGERSSRRRARQMSGAGIDHSYDCFERQLHSASAAAGRIQRSQQRGAWLTKMGSQRIHEDVRKTRLTPAESVFQGLRKMVRDLAKREGKQVDFQIQGLDNAADRKVLQMLKDPLMHMLCNAVIHGIESPDARHAAGKNAVGKIVLQLETLGHRLHISLADDGRGIDLARVREIGIQRGLANEADFDDRTPDDLTALLFQPGFSTATSITELAGRGMGLSVAHEAVTRLQGEIRIDCQPGAGCKLLISVPQSVSMHHLVLAACGEQTYALPVHAIERLLRVKVNDITTIEGRPIVNFQGRPIPLISLAHALGAESAELAVTGDVVPIIVVRSGSKRYALVVDALLGKGEYLIRELSGPAAAVSRFMGGIILENGKVALVIHPLELIKKLKPAARTPFIRAGAAAGEKKVATILVVDDSFTTAARWRRAFSKRAAIRFVSLWTAWKRSRTWWPAASILSFPTCRCRVWTASRCWPKSGKIRGLKPFPSFSSRRWIERKTNNAGSRSEPRHTS